MPFPFRFICDLLQSLEDEMRSKGKQKTSSKILVEDWFRRHRRLLDAPETDAAAVLSTLLPERRTDRVYSIRTKRLESIVGRALCLGSSRRRQLGEWKKPGLDKDLADCVQEVLQRSPNPTQREAVTVEQIDKSLLYIASSCRFSSTTIQSSRPAGMQKADSNELAQFYICLTPRDAKWFTRLVLKSFAPTTLDVHAVCEAYDPRLPKALAFRDDFAAAIAIVQDHNQESEPENPVKLGIKVGRHPWLKARSIKHCADMIGKRQISCEQKVDGEYCQIHIDLSKPKPSEIQIFSKSGKDSTKDRENLHCAVRESLRLGQRDCPIWEGCILEGELVVYSDKSQKILPFHKIRKHVSRSGSYIGTAGDSQRHYYEHLMIIYYDILMIDNTSLLGMSQSNRFKQLESLISVRKGHAELVQRQIIDFQKRDACWRLREAFAKCIIAREEGLVLKPDIPYFDFSSSPKRYASGSIKIKKEYLKGFGDVGDFAVIGASYDATTAKKSKVENLKYTHFFVASLENRKEAQASTEQPKYVVTNVVTLNDTQLKYFRKYCNPIAVPLNENIYAELDFRVLRSAERPTDVFPNPLVFDVYCFSFEKAPNSNMFTMRFPQVSKIHLERSWLDVLSFDKIQEAARDATEAPELEDSQEMRLWLTRIENAEPKSKFLNNDSQATVSTVSAASTISAVSMTAPKSSIEEDMYQRSNLQLVFRDKSPTATPLSSLGTPPTSSDDTAGPINIGGATKDLNIRPGGRKRKRPVIEELSSSKESKRCSQHNTMTSREQQPLGNRSSNNSQEKARSSASASPPPDPGTLDTTVLPEGPFTSSLERFSKTANKSPSSPSARARREKNNYNDKISFGSAKNQAPLIKVNCDHAKSKTECAFENCSFLLAPCISKCAWIQDLLRGHGILEVATDPRVWTTQIASVPSFSANTSSSEVPVPGSSCPFRRSRLKKICLVEVKHTGAMNDFIKVIEAAYLTRKNGQRDWVSVYDWRILEDITKVESGALDSRPDPWRSRYVGIA